MRILPENLLAIITGKTPEQRERDKLAEEISRRYEPIEDMTKIDNMNLKIKGVPQSQPIERSRWRIGGR